MRNVETGKVSGWAWEKYQQKRRVRIDTISDDNFVAEQYPNDRGYIK